MDNKSLYTEEEKEKIEEFKTKVEDITHELQDMYMEIQDIRKSGRDPLIAEFTYRNIRSKLEYVLNSQEELEISKIKVMIGELRKEMDDAKAQEVIDVKKEINHKMQQEGITYIGEVKEED